MSMLQYTVRRCGFPHQGCDIGVISPGKNTGGLQVFGQEITMTQPADFLIIGRPCFNCIAVETVYGDNAGLRKLVRQEV